MAGSPEEEQNKQTTKFSGMGADGTLRWIDAGEFIRIAKDMGRHNSMLQSSKERNQAPQAGLLVQLSGEEDVSTAGACRFSDRRQERSSGYVISLYLC